jgi:hypothetical protein
MTKQEIIKLMILIESVYSNFITKSETLINWFDLCGEMDYDQVMENLRRHIRRSPYPPTMTDLTRITANMKHSPQTLQGQVEQEKKNGRSIPAWMNEYTPRNSTRI